MDKSFTLEFPGKKTGELYVNCCGITKAESLNDFGPAVKPHYLLHFITDGKGIFEMGGYEYSLEKGCGFLITPDELSYYRADENEPWTYVWVGFNGSLTDQIVKNIGLSSENPVFKADDADEIYRIVQEMTENDSCEMYDELLRNGLLAVLLSSIFDKTIASVKSEADRTNYYVRKAVEYIQSNYCNPIKITEVADYVGINRSYLYTLFMNAIGISPHQFLATFRITRAAELLHSSSFPIESIALSCGYMDSLVFTKAFKQMKGLSPSVYRKAIRNGEVKKTTEHLQQVEDLINHIKKLDE
ncbi:MAG: AraC family transcriptional regulator [Lachnospiraceae bacterium]|nr:AraC family transcriptional regulator [Lachnospiraceae bacterium]